MLVFVNFFPYWPTSLCSSAFCSTVVRHYLWFGFEEAFMSPRRITNWLQGLSGGWQRLLLVFSFFIFYFDNDDKFNNNDKDNYMDIDWQVLKRLGVAFCLGATSSRGLGLGGDVLLRSAAGTRSPMTVHWGIMFGAAVGQRAWRWRLLRAAVWLQKQYVMYEKFGGGVCLCAAAEKQTVVHIHNNQ